MESSAILRVYYDIELHEGWFKVFDCLWLHLVFVQSLLEIYEKQENEKSMILIISFSLDKLLI